MNRRGLVLITYAHPVTGLPIRLQLWTELLGPLAVHPVLFEPHRGCSITHPATGYRVMALPSRAAADRWASELSRLDWSFTSPDHIPPATKHGVVEAYRRRGLPYTPPPPPDRTKSRSFVDLEAGLP